MQNPEPEELLKVPEVAQILRLSNKKVYQLVESGALRAIRIDQRSIRVRRSALEAFLAEHETAKPAGTKVRHSTSS